MICFLASLPNDEYDIVMEVFQLFESCELKDQKLSRNKRGIMVNSKLDCKGVNFKPLRGIPAATRKNLLTQLRDKEISFPELSSSCKRTKKMEEVKKHFLKYLHLDSWEVAIEKYPAYTKKERMEAFIDLDFKKDITPSAFVAYCKQAKCSILSQESPSDDCIRLGNLNSSAILLNYNVLQVEDKDLVSAASSSSCHGFNLTILDTPEVLLNIHTYLYWAPHHYTYIMVRPYNRFFTI